jgi:hypothetical protein
MLWIRTPLSKANGRGLNDQIAIANKRPSGWFYNAQRVVNLFTFCHPSDGCRRPRAKLACHPDLHHVSRTTSECHAPRSRNSAIRPTLLTSVPSATTAMLIEATYLVTELE